MMVDDSPCSPISMRRLTRALMSVQTLAYEAVVFWKEVSIRPAHVTMERGPKINSGGST